MTDKATPEALRLAAWLNEGSWHQMRLGDVEAAGRELRRQHARIAELEAEIAAVGAGGVQALSAAPAEVQSTKGAMWFTKKPVTIQAIQWTGGNLREVITFTDGPPDTRSHHAGMAWDEYRDLVARDGLKIYTLEGKMLASPGDWIIRGVKGEFYPCKPNIFQATYTAASPTPPAEQPLDPDGEAFRAAARLGLTLRFYGACAQSSMPGTPSAYVVTHGGDRAEAMREAVEKAAAVIASGGEAPTATLAPPAEQQAQPGAVYAPMQGLSAYLCAEAIGVKGVAAETLRQWADEVDAASAEQAAPKAAPGEPVASAAKGAIMGAAYDFRDAHISGSMNLKRSAHAALEAAVDNALAAQAAPQQEAQEPVMIYHGRCTIDCGEHGHHDMEMLRMIPAGSKLYTAPQPAPAELEQLKGRISRIGLDIDRALHGQVNEQSPVGAGRLAAIAALAAKPDPAPLSDDGALLDWLDQQREAYGFQDLHEGNRWEVRGAYSNLREAIRSELAALAAQKGTP